MWSGSPVSSNLRVEVCRFIPSFAAHAAVALEADPHQIRSRNPAEYGSRRNSPGGLEEFIAGCWRFWKIDPAIVYGMNKTGRIVTETNVHFLADAELQEWNDAVDEYHQKVEAGETQ
jgi:hypothetical protein